jgi:glycerol uptake facilitator-like aquaporin
MRPLGRRLAAEALGTAFLLAVIVGSGIMGERLAGGNEAIALLANSIATGLGLAVLIAVFAEVSGAHFNPVVTIASTLDRTLSWKDALAYVPVQIAAALAGVAAAHLMFGEALFSAATKARTGPAQWWSEAVATFGLLMVIRGCAGERARAAPWAIGAYIAAAYWFTASTSFANPAVTLARSASNSFVGIRPEDVAGFVLAQLLGLAAAVLVLPRVLRR